MDNGTLLLNDISYSGGGGTLVVNGISYSGKQNIRKCASGRVVTSTSATITIDCGFKPSYIAISQGASHTSDANVIRVYDASRSTTRQCSNGSADAFPTTTANRLGSITDDGFTLTKTNNVGYVNWFAME